MTSRILAALTLSALIACGPRSLPEFDAADIGRLESELVADPGDAGARIRLASAYHRAGRFDEARQILDPVIAEDDSPALAYLLSGMASERLDDWTAAREAYGAFLDRGREDPLEEEIRGRLALAVQRELRVQARSALDREAELSGQAPEPRSVAVFPLRVVGGGETLEPLSAAMTELIVTDLQLSGALTLLERAKVQALLDEMALAEAGYAEPGTGARVGRLLAAEHVVQGVVTSLGQETLRLDAAVLRTERQEPRGQTSGEGTLDELFDVEKQIVFGVLDAMGVQITAAERERIQENRAANLTSFLAYGRGLRALDRGDYREALEHFDQAASLDPDFAPARAQRQRAQGMQTASAASPAAAPARPGGGEAAPEPVAAAPAEESGLLLQTANEVNPSPVTQMVQQASQQTSSSTTAQQATERNSSQEAQGTQGVTQATTARITLTIRRPGSGGN